MLNIEFMLSKFVVYNFITLADASTETATVAVRLLSAAIEKEYYR